MRKHPLKHCPERWAEDMSIACATYILSEVTLLGLDRLYDPQIVVFTQRETTVIGLVFGAFLAVVGDGKLHHPRNENPVNDQ